MSQTVNYERPSEPVQVTLADGTAYRLRYRHGTLKRIKEELGISFMRMTGFAEVDEDKLPRLLFLGLTEYHPEVTQEQLDNLIDGAACQYVMAKIIEAATGQTLSKNGQSSQS